MLVINLQKSSSSFWAGCFKCCSLSLNFGICVICSRNHISRVLLTGSFHLSPGVAHRSQEGLQRTDAGIFQGIRLEHLDAADNYAVKRLSPWAYWTAFVQDVLGSGGEFVFQHAGAQTYGEFQQEIHVVRKPCWWIMSLSKSYLDWSWLRPML